MFTTFGSHARLNRMAVLGSIGSRHECNKGAHRLPQLFNRSNMCIGAERADFCNFQNMTRHSEIGQSLVSKRRKRTGRR